MDHLKFLHRASSKLNVKISVKCIKLLKFFTKRVDTLFSRIYLTLIYFNLVYGEMPIKYVFYVRFSADIITLTVLIVVLRKKNSHLPGILSDCGAFIMCAW